MLFSYNWLKNNIKGKLLKPKKLAELLTMHLFEVNEVKKTGNDWALDIDVLPNRGADCFSHAGIAREIAAITGLNYASSTSELPFMGQRTFCFFPPFATLREAKEDKKLKANDFISVDVKYKWACLRYTARVIDNVKVGPSPKWLQERLKVCGLRPINNIVDIANYVMLETGQPLHAFDFEKLEDKKIIVRFAKKGEKITTLDTRTRQSRAKGEDETLVSSPGQNFELNPEILVIADAKTPIAIAGIKGGKKAEIHNKTKTIVLESANFNNRIIRQSSKKLGLKTDASLRFEHGLDPNLTEAAINQAAFLIQNIAGGRVAKDLINIYPKKVLPKKIKLDLDYVGKLLGVKISEKEIKNILNRFSFKIYEVEPRKSCPRKSCRKFEVVVPTWRLDISLPEDLIEEIGRIYGYQKIEPEFPIACLIPPKRNFEIFWENCAKNILKEIGFSEVYNYSLTAKLPDEIFGSGLIELENPMSSEQKYLRPSLIPNLLKNIQKNQKNFSDIRIFELGKTFENHEKRMLAAIITGAAFYQLKGIIDLLLNKLGISDIWYSEVKPSLEKSQISFWNSKKCAEIKIGREKIGFLGEIKQAVLENYKIEKKAIVFEINFEKLQKLCSEETIYKPMSRFPAAIRDLAILVPRVTKVAEVLNKINIVGGSLVKDVDLFDIYEGEELADGKKNLAFHIIYQPENKTLTAKEIDEIHNKIITILETNAEWAVRK